MARPSEVYQSGRYDLEWYRRMRDIDPVWRDPKTGSWNVFRYRDATAVLSDHQTFSSNFRRIYPDQEELSEGNILATDPPYHHQLRSLVSQAFTPRAIARLEPHIEELTEGLLDRAKGRSQMELVSDLAYPLPVIVIAELLGVPAADRSRFKEWADALLAQDTVDPFDKSAIEQASKELRKFQDYLGEHVRQRGIQPRQDLFSDLVAAKIDLPLARLESRIALVVLLRRFSRLRVDPDFPLELYGRRGFNGTRTLHLLVERAV